MKVFFIVFWYFKVDVLKLADRELAQGTYHEEDREIGWKIRIHDLSAWFSDFPAGPSPDEDTSRRLLMTSWDETRR